MYFRILTDIKGIKTIAIGRGIRELKRLNRVYGKAQWRKRKGTARIVELHWYEAHGIGRKEFKIKRFIEDGD